MRETHQQTEVRHKVSVVASNHDQPGHRSKVSTTNRILTINQPHDANHSVNEPNDANGRTQCRVGAAATQRDVRRASTGCDAEP